MTADRLRDLSARWRELNPGHDHGVALIWEGEVYAWKSELRDPQHERPGVVAVAADGELFVAEGGDDDAGAETWAEYSPS